MIKLLHAGFVQIFRCSFRMLVVEFTLDILKKFRMKFCSLKLEESRINSVLFKLCTSSYSIQKLFKKVPEMIHWNLKSE